jgi:energy-coupling factor transport system ATP-binding protein
MIRDRTSASPHGASLEGVSFAYPRVATPALQHVDWRIVDGEFAVVAGESGSGKSTLLRCLNGLVPHFSGGRFGGAVIIGGADTRESGVRDLSEIAGFVFQDPEAQSVAKIVEDEIAFGMEQRGVPPATMRRRVEEALDLLSIANLREREVATLSGGERQRVAVASAITMQPHMIVLDEPTSQLDPWGAEDVIAALERLNHDLGITIVLSEHRLERVLPSADRLTFLTGGSVVADGPARETLGALPAQMLPPVARLGRSLEWFPPPLTVKEARALVQATGFEPVRQAAAAPAVSGEPVVRVERLSTSFGRHVVQRDLSLEIRAGEVVAIVGRNGSGKTTLLRSIVGFHRPDRGRIVVNGREVAKQGTAEIAKEVGYLPQRASSLLFCDSVRAELEFTLKHHAGRGRDPDKLLAELDLAHLADRHPRDLSAGQQERAALAAVLVADPKVLLLDEPTRGMDARRKADLARSLRRRSAEGVAVVLATHDIELVAEVATRVVMLGNGEVIADGPPREVLTGSLSYTTQMNKVFGGSYLTVADVVGET